MVESLAWWFAKLLGSKFLGLILETDHLYAYFACSSWTTTGGNGLQHRLHGHKLQ